MTADVIIYFEIIIPNECKKGYLLHEFYFVRKISEITLKNDGIMGYNNFNEF
ncbi:MAG: hypothetical protein RHS_4024 [Robinsoniella sp. RHS]|nr:MAG: hypothetical protein RHS_4024 [Robinsoniella sp. RHS]